MPILGETSTSRADRWIPHPGGTDGFPKDLSFFEPKVEGSSTRAHALSLLEDCVPPEDAAWLDALEVFITFEIGFHIAYSHPPNGDWALISCMMKRMQEEENHDVALHGPLNATITRSEELEEKLKCFTSRRIKL